MTVNFVPVDSPGMNQWMKVIQKNQTLFSWQIQQLKLMT